MAARRDGAGSGLASGAFWCGMGLIIGSAFLNLGYDRLVGARLKGNSSEILPEFLATLYQNGGKMGVTITAVAAGLTIILLGTILGRAADRRRTAAELQPSAPRQQPYFYTSTMPGEEAPEPPMALKTRKYLSPQ